MQTTQKISAENFLKEKGMANEFESGERKVSIESLECLAVNYIKKNDTENIYRVLSTLIQMGSMKLAVNYAVSLYQ